MSMIGTVEMAVTHRCGGFWASCLLALSLVAPTAMADTATYDVTLSASWSSTTHPDSFPSTPHFSGLIGATHKSTVNFWTPGGLATRGLELVAEDGVKSALQSEVTQAINAGQAGSVLSGGGISSSPGSVTYRFTIREAYPLVTLVSMLAPSPDWFVGVHDFSLLGADDQWKTTATLGLDPYDAGTDSGARYQSANQDSQPRQRIRNLRGVVPFSNREVARLTFTRVDPPLPSISIEPVSVSEANATAAVTVRLSKASSVDVQVNVSTQDGSAQTPADYASASRLVRFSPGETSKQLFIRLVDDSNVESTEVFYLVLSDSLGATIATATTAVSIVDNDMPIADGSSFMVTTADHQGAGDYAWVHFAAGNKQWIDASCRARLTAAGWTLRVWDWAQISALPDRSAQDCTQILGNNDDGDGGDARPRIIVTPDRAGTGQYGWYQATDNKKQWVDATCRARLQAAGLAVVALNWSEIDAFADAPVRDCNALVAGDDDSSRNVYLTTTPDKQASGNYAWAVFKGLGKQWVDADCRSQLEARDISLRIESWSVISQISDTRARACADIR